MRIVFDGADAFAATGGAVFSEPAREEPPCLVFLHGAGMDHTVWALQARYFAHRGYRVLVPDLPGHGRSGGAFRDSIEGMADWLLGFLAHLKVHHAVAVGHSMGALIAMETAMRAPERIKALAMLGVASEMPVHPKLLEAAQAGEQSAIDMVLDWGFGRGGHLGGHRVPGMWMLGGANRMMQTNTPGALYNDLAACNAFKTGLETAQKTLQPALLILGRNDKMTPAKAGLKLAAAMPDARAHTLENTGHMMMVERPDEVLDLMAGFAAEVKSAAA